MPLVLLPAYLGSGVGTNLFRFPLTVSLGRLVGDGEGEGLRIGRTFLR